mmetsp:Transcript_152/g.548  ORF Transcript_152/g.548 Transcript_152/m.548 type:complete len:306 (-) Transcript_152:696-1613(-)
MSSINWPMGVTNSAARFSASCEKIKENPSNVTTTTVVNPIEYLDTSTSSARMSYRKYESLRWSTLSSSLSMNRASQGTTWISIARRCSASANCFRSAWPMMAGLLYNWHPSTWANIKPFCVSPVVGAREKGTRSGTNHGSISALSRVQSPPTASDAWTALMSSMSSALHAWTLSFRSSKGSVIRSMSVMMTTLRVVVAPIWAPIVSARMIEREPSSSPDDWLRLRALASVKRRRAFRTRTMRTRRMKRSSLSIRMLRPARVPMRAARAALAMGPWLLRSLAPRTMMSNAMDTVAMKSRKKNKLHT